MQLAELGAAQRNASNFARSNIPAITNPTKPPHALLNLYDGEEFGSVHSEEDGGLGADVANAIDHYQQLEAARHNRHSFI